MGCFQSMFILHQGLYSTFPLIRFSMGGKSLVRKFHGVQYRWQLQRNGFWPMHCLISPMSDLCFFLKAASLCITSKQCTNTSLNQLTVLWSHMMIPLAMAVVDIADGWHPALGFTSGGKGHSGSSSTVVWPLRSYQTSSTMTFSESIATLHATLTSTTFLLTSTYFTPPSTPTAL